MEFFSGERKGRPRGVDPTSVMTSGIHPPGFRNVRARDGLGAGHGEVWPDRLGRLGLRGHRACPPRGWERLRWPSQGAPGRPDGAAPAAGAWAQWCCRCGQSIGGPWQEQARWQGARPGVRSVLGSPCRCGGRCPWLYERGPGLPGFPARLGGVTAVGAGHDSPGSAVHERRRGQRSEVVQDTRVFMFSSSERSAALMECADMTGGSPILQQLPGPPFGPF